MAGLVPAIHVLAFAATTRAWMAGPGPAKTELLAVFTDLEGCDQPVVRMSNATCGVRLQPHGQR